MNAAVEALLEASDLDLLARYAASRSNPAFTELVRRYVDLVYSTCLRRLRDPHLAQDATQAVFFVLSQKAGRISNRVILAGWLYQTAHLISLHAMKMQKRRAFHEQQAAAQATTVTRTVASATTGYIDNAREISSLLESALDCLGRHERDIILLRYFQQMDVADAARQAGVSPNTASKQISRALDKLRRYFAARGIAAPAEMLSAALAVGASPPAPAGLAIASAGLLSPSAAALAKGTLATTAATIKIAASILVGIAVTAGVAVTVARMNQLQMPQPPASVPPPALLAANVRPATVTIGGIARDEQARPIANAQLGVFWQLPSSMQNGPGTRVHTVRTTADSNGRWSCPGVPRESLHGVRLRLIQRDYAAVTFDNLPEDQLLSQSLILVLKPGVDLAGEVVDAQGKDISGASVAVASDWPWGDSAAPKATTDDNGQFVLRHVTAASTVKLNLQMKGFAPAWLDVPANDPAKPLRLALSIGRTLHGRVTDGAGHPVRGASVSIHHWEGSASVHADTQTDADGHYELSHVADGELQFDAGKSGYATFTATIEDGQEALDASLTKLSSFQGSVTDAATHEPIPHFKVLIAPQRPGETTPSFPAWSAKSFDGGQYDIIPERYAGDIHGWYLRVEAPGYLPAAAGPLTKSRSQDFALQSGRDLTGRVIGPDGKPAANAVVELSLPDQNLFVQNGEFSNLDRQRAVTDARGSFTLSPQSTPFLLVAVNADGYAALDQNALAKGADVQLAAWGRVTGTLLIHGKPAANERVSAEPAGNEIMIGGHDPYALAMADATTDAQGHFVLDCLPPGVVMIQQDSPHPQAGANQAVTVAPGATVAVNLGAGGTVIGRVVIPPNLAGPAYQRTVAYAETELPPPAIPDSVKKAPRALQMIWWKGFLLTDAGKAYQESTNKLRPFQHRYEFTVGSDGKFRLDAVAPGSYSVNIFFEGPDGASAIGQGEFTVPPDHAIADPPLMLPDIVLQAAGF